MKIFLHWLQSKLDVSWNDYTNSDFSHLCGEQGKCTSIRLATPAPLIEIISILVRQRGSQLRVFEQPLKTATSYDVSLMHPLSTLSFRRHVARRPSGRRLFHANKIFQWFLYAHSLSFFLLSSFDHTLSLCSRIRPWTVKAFSRQNALK